jgi:hypothetical protein
VHYAAHVTPACCQYAMQSFASLCGCLLVCLPEKLPWLYQATAGGSATGDVGDVSALVHLHLVFFLPPPLFTFAPAVASLVSCWRQYR